MGRGTPGGGRADVRMAPSMATLLAVLRPEVVGSGRGDPAGPDGRRSISLYGQRDVWSTANSGPLDAG
jgi:hypothetical protein